MSITTAPRRRNIIRECAEPTCARGMTTADAGYRYCPTCRGRRGAQFKHKGVADLDPRALTPDERWALLLTLLRDKLEAHWNPQKCGISRTARGGD